LHGRGLAGIWKKPNAELPFRPESCREVPKSKKLAKKTTNSNGMPKKTTPR
jgi:hypothetical protein